LGGTVLGGGQSVGFRPMQVFVGDATGDGMAIELLEPWLPERNDFLARFVARRGEGPHHMTFKVAEIVGALREVESAGFRPVSVNLVNEGWKEAFLDPKDAPGVVVQLAQSSDSSDWGVPLPDDYPEVTVPPATLERVTHAVASLDVGLALFRDLLAGDELDKGEDAEGRWVDLAWPGPGRVRLIEPATPSSPLAAWIGDRPGRVHHLSFLVDGADPHEVAPEENEGVRLYVHA
jgi:hypothetical protein